VGGKGGFVISSVFPFSFRELFFNIIEVVMSEIEKVTDWIDAAKHTKSTRNTANYLAFVL
jgi:hypothetical protein